MKSATVIEMVRRAINDRGHGGLVSANRECACELADLAPCGNIGEDCESGIRIEGCDGDCAAGGGCDFHIEVQP